MLPDATGLDTRAPISAARRVMQALELLAETADGLTVTGVCNRLKVEKSTISRLLASLEVDGYVVRDPVSDRYRLTLKVQTLALRHSMVLGFPGVCLPIMQDLAEQTGELVQLAAVDGDRLYYLAGADDGKHRLNIRPLHGQLVVPHATASGKAWLATLPTETAVAVALAHGMTQQTPRTTTNISDLIAELEVVKREGFAIIVDELTDGVSAVGVVIGVARFGRAVGTIAVSAPTSRYDLSRMRELVPPLTAAAAQLEVVWPMSIGSAFASGDRAR